MVCCATIDPFVLTDHDVVGTSLDLDQAPDSEAATENLLLSKHTRQVFETDAGTAWAGIGDELRPFGFERLANCLLCQLLMAMRLSIGDALIEQLGV